MTFSDPQDAPLAGTRVAGDASPGKSVPGTRQPQSVEVDGPSGRPKFALVRPGHLFLTTESQTFTYSEIIERLISSLEGDPRVLRAAEPDYEHFSEWQTYYPMRPAIKDLINGSDALNVFDIGSPIFARVRVPTKNQRIIHGADDVPTDTYVVAWDGITALVGWEQEESEWVPISAGHVVLEILDDAAKKAGFGTYGQACGPGCDYQFLHTTLLVEEDAESPDSGALEILNDRVVRLPVPRILNLEDAVVQAGFAIRLTMATFAEFKNATRRLLDLDLHVRDISAHMLSHNHAYTQISTLPLIQRPKARWRNKGWRREVRALIAEAWLCLANMDVLSKASHDNLTELKGSQRDYLPLFKNDYASDVAALERLNTTPVTDAIKHMSTSIDNRVLTAATALGALGGGLAGAVAAIVSSN